MFCHECGESIPDGSKFCRHCGNTTTVAAAPPAPPPGDTESRKKGGGGFFSSPAGIALVAILGVAVLAGITLGIIFLVRGSSSGEVDAATMQVWDEYESTIADDSISLAQVSMDPNALTKAREDMDRTQKRVEELERVLQRTAGTEARKQNPSITNKVSTSIRDRKADEMAAALEAYKKYIEKMNELYGVLVSGNLLDPTIVNLVNAILKDLQALAQDAKTTAGVFLKDNTRVVAKVFDPPVLALPKTIANNIEKDIRAKQEAEKQRLAAEQASAQQAAAAAEAEIQRQQAAAAAAAQAQMVTCPNCGGAGTVEGGDGRYTCGFCNGTGTVTRSKADTYNPADWRDY
jgi:hypothetical protein